MEALIELCKLSKSQRLVLTGFGEYLLGILKLNNSTNVNNQIFTLLGLISNEKQEIEVLYRPFKEFIHEWLTALIRILHDGHKEHLRKNDIDLTRHVLRLLGLFVEKGKELTFENIKIIPDFLAVN
jgi:hypothetical protein